MLTARETKRRDTHGESKTNHRQQRNIRYKVIDSQTSERQRSGDRARRYPALLRKK